MFVTVDLPPGISRTGTTYKSRGRWYDANLMRWFAGALGPVGGWAVHSTSAVSGKARAILTWRDNNRTARAAIGTHTGLYVMSLAGVVSDITPTGFSAGRADAIYGSGYGTGPYGAGTYGSPRDSTNRIIEASVWQLDTWGQYLVGVMAGDDTLYQWGLDTATPAVAISNAPSATGVLVTSDRIMMALGADGDPRNVAWSDQEDNTVWTDTVTNYAGSFPLQTSGKIVCAKRINGGNLIFTDVDVWLASFVGQPLVYGFEKRGDGCGVISQGCVVVTDAATFWMGRNGFYSYNGFTTPVACEVQDYVFSDINLTQASKVTAFHNSSFGEVWWFYCSANATEIDRCVVYNYRENHWNKHALVRLSACDRGVFTYPLMMGSDGYAYDHESGWTHGGTVPYAKSGPIEVGQGDNLFSIMRIIPDESTLGSVTISFDAQMYPMGSVTTYGPYTLSSLTDARLTARQVEISYTGTDGENFRIGSFRYDGRARGKR